MTKVMDCACGNEQQDAIHGKGRRVFNMTAAQTKTFRCTVCSKEVVKGEDGKKKGK